MKRIKESITALAGAESKGALRLIREEHTPMPYEYFELALKYAVKISIIFCVTVLILNAGVWKLMALFAFIIFFSLIYFGSRD